MINLGILIALTVAITKAVEMGNFINKKFMPVIAVVFALGLVFITKHFGEGNSEAIIQALIAAFTAVGLYSAQKNIRQGVKQKLNE